MNEAAQIAVGVVIAVLLGPVLIAMTVDAFGAAWEMWRDLFRGSSREPTETKGHSDGD